MNTAPRKLNLSAWDERYDQLRHAGLREPVMAGRCGGMWSAKKISGWSICSSTIRPPRSGSGIFC